MKRIDLHTHSYYSDGTSSPSEVVRLAAGEKVELLSLSDHDTILGLEEAGREASRLGIRFVHGIEINTVDSDQVHILGYGIDPEDSKLGERLKDFRNRRVRRIQEILRRLQGQGLEVGLEDVRGVSRESVGRPHVADALLRKGYVRSRQEAFQKYLIPGKPGYVAPMGPTLPEAVQAIREAGGTAVLAHPGVIRNGAMDLKRWVGCGLEGLEAYYLSHSREAVRGFLDQARQFSLIATGGSDYHGPGTGREEIGGVEVPEDVFGRILEKVGRNGGRG